VDLTSNPPFVFDLHRGNVTVLYFQFSIFERIRSIREGERIGAVKDRGNGNSAHRDRRLGNELWARQFL
jgi:hypothetical protein